MTPVEVGGTSGEGCTGAVGITNRRVYRGRDWGHGAMGTATRREIRRAREYIFLYNVIMVYYYKKEEHNFLFFVLKLELQVVNKCQRITLKKSFTS